jgi:hypothetical protein
MEFDSKLKNDTVLEEMAFVKKICQGGKFQYEKSARVI